MMFNLFNGPDKHFCKFAWLVTLPTAEIFSGAGMGLIGFIFRKINEN